MKNVHSNAYLQQEDWLQQKLLQLKECDLAADSGLRLNEVKSCHC